MDENKIVNQTSVKGGEGGIVSPPYKPPLGGTAWPDLRADNLL